MVDIQGHKMPLGMRLNNPGNLKVVHHAIGGTDQHGEFAKFDSLMEGVYAYVKLVVHYWQYHHILTLNAFINRYAPSTENDVMKYEVFIARRTGLNIMHNKTQNLMLDRAWRALDFMRAQIAYEQGSPWTEYRTYPEWIGMEMWRNAMLSVPMWKDQL